VTTGDLYTYWTVKLTNATYGSTFINTFGTENAIIDTGTSLLCMAQTDYDYFSA